MTENTTPDEKNIREKMEAGLSREQAVKVLADQAEHDRKTAAPERKEGTPPEAAKQPGKQPDDTSDPQSTQEPKTASLKLPAKAQGKN